MAQHFDVALSASLVTPIKAGSLAAPRMRDDECSLHGGDASVTIDRDAFCSSRNSVGLHELPRLKASAPYLAS
jgi:hypothetical protein